MADFRLSDSARNQLNNINTNANRRVSSYSRKDFKRIKRDYRRSQYNELRDSTMSYSSNSSLLGSGVGGALPRLFSILLLVLTTVLIIRITNGSQEIPTFTSFLEMLSDIPRIDINWSLPFLENGDWGFLDFIRQAFSVAFAVGKFILDSLGTLFTFCFYILRWAFF